MVMNLGSSRDIMTANPVAAMPTDKVSEVAQRMKDADVGLIPIVDDHSSKKPVGVLTDRDLAIRVVAAGLDPNTTNANAVMSPQPISCQLDAPIAEITDLMSRHQIRRILIVDKFGRMVGIVAQADLAREIDPQTTGEVLEKISQET